METRICACCGQPFQPRPQVPNQTYCSSRACQRDRRQSWQRDKLQYDRFYRESPSACARLDKYFRQTIGSHPKSEKATQKGAAFPSEEVAKLTAHQGMSCAVIMHVPGEIQADSSRWTRRRFCCGAASSSRTT